MERSQFILGGVVAIAVGAVVALAFSGGSEGEGSVEGEPARPAAGAGSGKPEPTFGTPRPGPNQALARLKAAGEVTPMKREGHRSKIDEARDGFADRAPMMSGKPPVREPDPSASPSPSMLKPGMRWPLDRDGIRGAVRESLPELTECYDAWVKLNPKLGGRVVVTFTIAGVEGEEGGKVVGAKLSDQSTLGHAPMEGCIVQVFEDLRFERPQDGTINVTYPLEFSNGERDAGN